MQNPKNDIDFLKALSMTSLSRVLGEECLQDGKIHSKQQLYEYIQARVNELGLSVPNKNHMSSGINLMLKNNNAVRLDTGMYQANSALTHGDESVITNNINLAIDKTDSLMDSILKVSRTVNFTTANDLEIKFLNILKDEYNSLEKFKAEMKELVDQTENENLEESQEIGMSL